MTNRFSAKATIMVFAGALACAACSDGAETAEGGQAATSEADAGDTGWSGEFPQLVQSKGPGVLQGTIGEHQLDVAGTCGASAEDWNFWTDGTDFSADNDSNGDGQWLNIQIVNINDNVMAALTFFKDDEKVYKGTVPIAVLEQKRFAVDAPLGREQLISADFTVRCE